MGKIEVLRQCVNSINVSLKFVEKEQEIIDANERLIEIMEKKIEEVLEIFRLDPDFRRDDGEKTG